MVENWRRAVPGVTAEAHGTGRAPAAPAPPGPAAPAVPGHDGGPAPIVVAGTSLGVGPPPPERPGPAAPRSALPAREAAALSDAASRSDVVVGYGPVLDAGGLRGGPFAEAAAAAAPHAVPVVALAERVEVTRRELASAGISGAHEVHGTDVTRVARSWTPGWA